MPKPPASIAVTNRVPPVLTSDKVYEVAIKSPLEAAPKLSAELGCQVWLKREDLQPVHSFKLRGAYNKIANLSVGDKAKGVIAASAGNHAQGVALAAHKLGISALIVMPRTTPAIKVEAVRGYGAEVVLSGDNYSEAYEACEKLRRTSGRTLVHPFDDPLVIAGQGTIGREIIEQTPTVTHILVPVGGGGLLAGIAQYVKAVRPAVQIIGVEPVDSAAMRDSLAANRRVTLAHVGIFADGVAVKQVGVRTFQLAKRYVDQVITVDNDQICAAIKDVFEATRSIVEPAGALALAGLRALAEQGSLPSGAVAVAICSGANMSFERLQFIAERTLLGSGKEALFAVRLREEPGALHSFCQEVINGFAVTEFNYRLSSRQAAYIFVGVNLSSPNEREAFIGRLQRYKYDFHNLSSDDLAKEHVRHMIGGPSPLVVNEHAYVIQFPERPRALGDFLRKLGRQWNISLFHYRGLGSDQASVLIGFEAPNRRQLEASLKRTNYDYQAVDSEAFRTFINPKL